MISTKGSSWLIQSSLRYHVTKAIIIIMMSYPTWPQGHHQVHGLHHQTDQASSWTSDHHHLKWTMGSTIKCNGSKPSARATSSTIIIKASISIMSRHHGLHHIIRVLMGQYQLIMSTSINLAASYCDHCKGHHQVSRFSS